MNKLTEQAKNYCRAMLEYYGRDEVVEMLEGIGIACYDEETDEELIEAALDSVEAGDLEIGWSMADAKSAGTATYKLWLEMDEVWEDEIRDMEEDDYRLFPTGSLGALTAVQQGQNLLDTFSTTEDALEYVRQHMEENQFWPAIWWVSDHGNYWAIDLEGKEIK